VTRLFFVMGSAEVGNDLASAIVRRAHGSAVFRGMLTVFADNLRMASDNYNKRKVLDQTVNPMPPITP
jgi:hypothetical protein